MKWARVIICAAMTWQMLPSSMACAASPETSEPRIYVYGQHRWDDWENDPKSYWDTPFSSPIMVKGKLVRSCSELVETMQGEQITYQFQFENRNLACVEATILGNMQVPQKTMFDKRALAKDVEENLETDALPWNFSYTNGRPHRLQNITNIKGIAKHRAQVAFTIGDEMYGIEFISMADFVGDGTQQIYAEMNRVWLRPPENHKIENALFLLVRDVPGGPIHAKPFVFRPMAYDRPSKELLEKAKLLGD